MGILEHASQIAKYFFILYYTYVKNRNKIDEIKNEIFLDAKRLSFTYILTGNSGHH